MPGSGASVYNTTGGHVEAATFTLSQELVRTQYLATQPGTATFNTADIEGALPTAAYFSTFDGRGFYANGTCNPNSPTSCAGETVQFLTGDVEIIMPPVVSCDFDFDGDCDIDDIDMLVMEIVAGTNNPAFDLNGDGLVGARISRTPESDGWL